MDFKNLNLSNENIDEVKKEFEAYVYKELKDNENIFTRAVSLIDEMDYDEGIEEDNATELYLLSILGNYIDLKEEEYGATLEYYLINMFIEYGKEYFDMVLEKLTYGV